MRVRIRGLPSWFLCTCGRTRSLLDYELFCYFICARYGTSGTVDISLGPRYIQDPGAKAIIPISNTYNVSTIISERVSSGKLPFYTTLISAPVTDRNSQ
jgi:hypothetical protein